MFKYLKIPHRDWIDLSGNRLCRVLSCFVLIPETHFQKEKGSSDWIYKKIIFSSLKFNFVFLKTKQQNKKTSNLWLFRWIKMLKLSALFRVNVNGRTPNRLSIILSWKMGMTLALGWDSVMLVNCQEKTKEFRERECLRSQPSLR